MKIYIAGPMTGMKDFNYPAFHEVAERARARGWDALNPAEHDLGFATAHAGQHDLIRAHYMKLDMQMLAEADAIAFLPGWQKSTGAALEFHIAEVLHLLMLDARTFEPYYETAVEEAQRLVHGNRGADYGHPIDDFTRTGRIWGAILGIQDVTPELVALCMAAVKISREVNHPKRDNRVDLAGYAETAEMVHVERRRRGDG